MKKVDRHKVFDKFGGKCAYCGCDLVNGWHVDEIEPCRRKYKTVIGHYVEGKKHYTLHEWYQMKLTEDQIIDRGIKWVNNKTIPDGYEHPERLHIDNQFPACASCNINKHSMSLESFRQMIGHFINSLNGNSTQYKLAKRYGLIKETGKEVIFYFETLTQQPLNK